MTEQELREKIVKIIYDWMGYAATHNHLDGAIMYNLYNAQELADALIAAGLKFAVNYSFTAAFNSVQAERESDLERRLSPAEHRAEVAEKALDKATDLAYKYRTEADILSCSSCPLLHIFDSCKERGLYKDCSKRWKEELLQQAEKELAEEKKE